MCAAVTADNCQGGVSQRETLLLLLWTFWHNSYI